jgi:hypothetical protein
MSIDVSKTKKFNPYQHCKNDDCYTFSHTAEWCNNPQPKFCGCPYDYPDDDVQKWNDAVQQYKDMDTLIEES